MARTKKLLVSSAAMMIALWPMHSFAQEGPYDPLGLRFGGFDVHAGLDVGVESNDNIFADDTNKQSDVAITSSVNVSADSHWSRHSLSASASYDNRDYQDHSSENTHGYDLALRGRLDVYHDTEIGGGVGTRQAFEPRTDTNSPTDIREPVEYNVSSADVYASHTFNRIRVTARAAQNQYDYKDATLQNGANLDEDFRDYKETIYGGRVEYGLSPRIFLLVDGSTNTRKYDQDIGGVSRDSDGNSINGGVRLQLTNLLIGEVTAGRYRQKYDDPNTGTVDGAGFGANLTWYPTQIMNVQFTASRGVEESGVFNGAYVNTNYGVRINHSPRRWLNLSAGVNAGTRDYQGVLDRKDDYLTADLGATYLMNRRVQIRGGYIYDTNSSSGANPSNEFDANRFYLGLGLRL